MVSRLSPICGVALTATKFMEQRAIRKRIHVGKQKTVRTEVRMDFEEARQYMVTAKQFLL